MGGIAGCFCRKPLLPQAILGVVADAGIYAGEEGYAQEHPQHAEKSSAHQDRHNDPEAGNAGGIPQDLGPQNIAVKLLKSQNKDNEIEAGRAPAEGGSL